METKKIIIVDDDVDVINIAKTILENENYEVVVANGKDEALEVIASEKPDIAILDVMMNTQYEGFELAKAIKSNADYKKMPVLMQTSIEVFESPDEDAMGYARLYRSQMKDKDLEVLLVQDPVTQNVGIDYRNEKGEIVWLPIDGFIKKPVQAKTILSTIERFL